MSELLKSGGWSALKIKRLKKSFIQMLSPFIYKVAFCDDLLAVNPQVLDGVAGDYRHVVV